MAKLLVSPTVMQLPPKLLASCTPSPLSLIISPAKRGIVKTLQMASSGRQACRSSAVKSADETLRRSAKGAWTMGTVGGSEEEGVGEVVGGSEVGGELSQAAMVEVDEEDLTTAVVQRMGRMEGIRMVTRRRRFDD